MLLDSGTRRIFGTGATRDAETEKGRYELISPIVNARRALHLERGAEKYADRNWEKGIPLSSFYDSAMRHLNQWLAHKLYGVPLHEDVLAAADWNISGLIHTEELIARGALPIVLDDIRSGRRYECEYCGRYNPDKPDNVCAGCGAVK